MRLSLIAAMRTADRGIGNNGELLVRIPEDMLRFRDLTMGKAIIMGRKTFESIGRPLPGRRNMVISRTMEEQEGVTVFRSLVECFHHLVDDNALQHVFVIGGEEIYRQAIPWADDIHLTEISDESASPADTFFPKLPDSFVENTRLSYPGFDFVHYKRVRRF